MRLFDFTFYFCLFFLIGVGLASLEIENGTAIFLVFFILVIFLCWAFIQNKKAPIFLAGLCFFILPGFFYFHFFEAVKGPDVIILDEEISFQGIVAGDPDQRTKYQQLEINLEPPLKGEIIIYADFSPAWHYGDLIEFKGKIEKSPSGRLISGFPKMKLIASDKGNLLQTRLYGFKNKVIYNFQQVLDYQKAGLLSGLTLGERAGFSKEFEENLKQSGLVHIVALSGYNISVLILMVNSLFSRFLSRRRTFYFIILFIIAFVLMTGAEVSVVRAAIMGIIALLALRWNRLYSIRNAIMVSALVMVLFNPRVLIGDIGFQLSFLALLGIVYLMPAMKKFLRIKDSGFLDWKENGLTTISAQLAVVPILLMNFGSFSFLSFLANVLVLSVVPLTMAFGFVAGVLGFFSYYLSLIIARFTDVFLSYEIFIINFFAKISMPIIMESLNIFIVIVYYLLLIWFIKFARRIRMREEKARK